MRYSFKVWAQEATWPHLRDIWIEADRAGFWDVVWLNDHLLPPKSDRRLPIMEAWTLFGGLAAVTDRIRFGAMVTANTFRHPAVLAKQAATLDQMSNGRLEIGLGAGWHPDEHASFGIPLPRLRERFEMLEDTLEILHGLFTEDEFSYEGRHRSVQAAPLQPKPIQKPRPPFVIGGAGPTRTIPLAARWADQWNYPDYTNDLDGFASSLALLEAACESIGRPRAEIEVSVQFRYSGDTGEAVDQVGGYRELGADHVLVSFTPPTDPTLPPAVAEALAAI